MWSISDKNFTWRSLHLRMAFEAKVGITFDEQFSIYRTVRVVAHCAALAERFVLEDKWPRLFPMTLRAILIQSRHRQTACRFENVATMGIMALDAIHMAFDYRMMLRQPKFGFGLQMALKARRGIFSRIHDELATTAARFDVFASGTVA